MFNQQFDNQVAVVTGGASGIGFATAELLAKEGARVVIMDRDEEKASMARDQLLSDGRNAYCRVVDVSVSEEVEEVFADLSATLGSVDILIHSAGVGLERRFLDTTDAEWSTVIGVDLSGTFYCNRAAGRIMVAKGYGRIVNLASTAGVLGGTGRAAYGAAKGGVIMLTKVLAVELALAGITVNAIAPGAIETDLVASMLSAETRRIYRRAIPLDRYGETDEVAVAACFLASRSAAYITGHVLAVDGGFLAAGLLVK